MPIITQLQNITDFWNAHQYDLGEVNLFSTDEHTDINKESIKYLKSLATALQNASDLKKLPLEQTFSLKSRIQENDNVTDWVENIRAIGSEGTDILVKAIINILLSRFPGECLLSYRVYVEWKEIYHYADRRECDIHC